MRNYLPSAKTQSLLQQISVRRGATKAGPSRDWVCLFTQVVASFHYSPDWLSIINYAECMILYPSRAPLPRLGNICGFWNLVSRSLQPQISIPHALIFLFGPESPVSTHDSPKALVTKHSTWRILFGRELVQCKNLADVRLENTKGEVTSFPRMWYDLVPLQAVYHPLA